MTTWSNLTQIQSQGKTKLLVQPIKVKLNMSVFQYKQNKGLKCRTNIQQTANNKL